MDNHRQRLDKEAEIAFKAKKDQLDMLELKNEIERLLKTNQLLENQLLAYKFEYESLEHDDTKTLFYTGLPHFEMLDALYEIVKNDLPDHVLNKLTKFQILMLTLMKLRLNFPFKELGYKFSISCSTASRHLWNTFLSCSAS